ncbi:MAG: hypothetical protein AMJ53_09005 [Gammaproteobacteria bacterium SG8_11]|nr:MAG: hypothetical protein AMJ53_09005 [Gammaproteobacteria bacterium SG8_11]
MEYLILLTVCLIFLVAVMGYAIYKDIKEKGFTSGIEDSSKPLFKKRSAGEFKRETSREAIGILSGVIVILIVYFVIHLI